MRQVVEGSVLASMEELVSLGVPIQQSWRPCPNRAFYYIPDGRWQETPAIVKQVAWDDVRRVQHFTGRY